MIAPLRSRQFAMTVTVRMSDESVTLAEVLREVLGSTSRDAEDESL